MADRRTEDDRIDRLDDRIKDELEDTETESHEPPTREDLNDTGEGMPVNLGSGGYGGTAKTVEKKDRDRPPERR